jgi:hypothetical protein
MPLSGGGAAVLADWQTKASAPQIELNRYPSQPPTSMRHRTVTIVINLPFHAITTEKVIISIDLACFEH